MQFTTAMSVVAEKKGFSFRFSSEAHFVHFDTKYSSAEDATNSSSDPAAFLAFAVLLEVGDRFARPIQVYRGRSSILL